MASRGFECTPSHAALIIVQQRILAPLKLRLKSSHLVHQSSVETDLAPEFPHQFPGVETRAVYDFYDCHVNFKPSMTDGQNHAGVPTIGHLSLWYATSKKDVDRDHVAETEKFRKDLRDRFFKLGLPRPVPPASNLAESAQREMLVPAHNRSSVRRGRPRRGKKKS